METTALWERLAHSMLYLSKEEREESVRKFVRRVQQEVEAIDCLKAKNDMLFRVFCRTKKRWDTEEALRKGAVTTVCELLMQTFSPQKDLAAGTLGIVLHILLTDCHGLQCVWKGSLPSYISKCSYKWKQIAPTVVRSFSAYKKTVLDETLDSALKKVLHDNTANETAPRMCTIVNATKLLEMASNSPILCKAFVKAVLLHVIARSYHRYEDTRYIDALLEMLASFLRTIQFHSSAEITSLARESIMTSCRAMISQKSSDCHSRLRQYEFLGSISLLSAELSQSIFEEFFKNFSRENSEVINFEKAKDQGLETTCGIEEFCTVYPVLFMLMGACAHNGHIFPEQVLQFVFQCTKYMSQQGCSSVLRRYLRFAAVYVCCHRHHQIIDDGGSLYDDKNFQTSALRFIPQSLSACFLDVCKGKSKDDIRSFCSLESNSLGKMEWHKIPFATAAQFPESFRQIEHSYIEPICEGYQEMLFNQQEHLVQKRQIQEVVSRGNKKQLKMDTTGVGLNELPHEVLKALFSFSSHKRLCRLSLVSRTFYNETRCNSLWKKLFTKKWKDVSCSHGSQFTHDWKRNFQTRYLADLRRRTLSANAVYYICPICSCGQTCRSGAAFKTHLERHRKYRCQVADCGASYTSASAFRSHKSAHSELNI